LISEDLENKILRYRKILDQENELKLKKLDLSVATGELEREEISLTESLILMRDELSIMRPRVTDADKCGELNELKKTLHTLEQSVRSLDAKRMSLSENIGLLTSSLSSLESEKSEYDKLLSEWRIYELIMNAVSKKGIPTQILSTQLPGINEEISKILQGVAGFTVELEADKNSNAMDIYINYGDSRRIIECASGMEKMVSSLAIRVALINVSSLPKCDTLVIDEGFGTLDEINVEACNRLLSSLKRWFRNILVISHVDAVKDSVDMVLDITNEGKNSKVVYE
jgi:exonuclease SbcC